MRLAVKEKFSFNLAFCMNNFQPQFTKLLNLSFVCTNREHIHIQYTYNIGVGVIVLYIENTSSNFIYNF